MRHIFLILILTFSIEVFSQTKFDNKVIIKGKGIPENIKGNHVQKDLGGYEIYKIQKYVTQDTMKLFEGYKLIKSTEENHKGIKYELKKDSLIKTESFISFNSQNEKAERFYLEKGKYKANLSISNDSILINFWLWKINDTTWYHARESVKKKYPFDPETKYFIKLKNRQYESFYYSNFEITALTIPFKYHFGYKEGDITIDPTFDAEININTFIGKRLGKITYTYDTYKGMIENQWSVTIGSFIGLSSLKLDSITTSLSKMPIEGEINVPSISYGFGAVFNINNFNLGIFVGRDNALGVNGNKWNFDDENWLGFGFGYKLAFLGNPEK